MNVPGQGIDGHTHGLGLGVALGEAAGQIREGHDDVSAFAPFKIRWINGHIRSPADERSFTAVLCRPAVRSVSRG